MNWYARGMLRRENNITSFLLWNQIKLVLVARTVNVVRIVHARKVLHVVAVRLIQKNVVEVVVIFGLSSV